MAVVIRLKRAGATKRPFYRVVVADSRSPRDGRYIEQLGYYDPLTSPATFKIDAERFAAWIRNGATPSESVGVMVAKVAPEALRPAPLPVPAAPETPPKPKREKAAKTKAAPASKKKAAKKKATKATDKKAKARAKKKAGTAKPKAAKKKKSSK